MEKSELYTHMDLCCLLQTVVCRLRNSAPPHALGATARDCAISWHLFGFSLQLGHLFFCSLLFFCFPRLLLELFLGLLLSLFLGFLLGPLLPDKKPGTYNPKGKSNFHGGMTLRFHVWHILKEGHTGGKWDPNGLGPQGWVLMHGLQWTGLDRWGPHE